MTTCSKIDEGLAIIRNIAGELKKLDKHESSVQEYAADLLFKKNGLVWVSDYSDEYIRELICHGRDPVEYLTSCPYEVLIKAWNAVKGTYFEEKQKEVAVIDMFLNSRVDSYAGVDDIFNLIDYVNASPEDFIPGVVSMRSSADGLFSTNDSMSDEEMTALRDLLKYYRQITHKKIMSYRELFREMGTQTIWEYMQDYHGNDPETTIYFWWKDYDPGILSQKYYEEGIPGSGTGLEEFFESQQDLDPESITKSTVTKYMEKMGIHTEQDRKDYDEDGDTISIDEICGHLDMIIYYYPMEVKEMLKEEDGLVSYLMDYDNWLPEEINSIIPAEYFTYRGDYYDEGVADYFRCMGETDIWSTNEC